MTQKEKATARPRAAAQTSLWLLALAPFVAVALGARAIVPHVGDVMARRLATLGQVLRSVPAPSPPAEELVRPPMVQSPLTTSTAFLRWRSPAPPPSAPSSIVLPLERLARLTAAQLGRVRGVAAVDATGRPVGVRLSGVQALGLGLHEGDIVTSLDGHPTPTLDAGTAAATAALGSGRPNARATILRDGQTVAVTVQIPPTAAAAAGDHGSH